MTADVTYQTRVDVAPPKAKATDDHDNLLIVGERLNDLRLEISDDRIIQGEENGR